MSQVGAWDFAGEKLHALRQRAAAGRTDAGQGLALLRRFTFLLGEGEWFGAWANRRKVCSCRKALLLPLRDFGCGRGKVSAAQALLPWG